MNSNARNLIEQACLASSVIGPGLLLARATDGGMTLFLVMLLQYALGAVVGLVLYHTQFSGGPRRG